MRHMSLSAVVAALCVGSVSAFAPQAPPVFAVRDVRAGMVGTGRTVFAGDTIYAESEVLSKRESESRPHHGIVTVRTTGKKADGTVFMTFERTVLIPMRGHAVDDKLAY